MQEPKQPQQKNCQNCNFHTQGVGAVMQNGTIHIWQECSKGWGRIGYMPNPEELQDEIGAMIADALTIYYTENK